MSDICQFSAESVGNPPHNLPETLQVECPLCHAIRQAQKRSSGYVFPVHTPLMGDPLERRRWQRQADGTWQIVGA